MARRKRKQTNGVDGEPLDEGQQDATAAHNVGNRQEELTKALAKVFSIDEQIATIVEQEIKDLRSDKSDVIQSLRERFNIPAAIFRARYYSYRMERKAAADNDQATLDQIRELYELAPVGETVDFLGALDASRPPADTASA